MKRPTMNIPKPSRRWVKAHKLTSWAMANGNARRYPQVIDYGAVIEWVGDGGWIFIRPAQKQDYRQMYCVERKTEQENRDV